MGITRRQFIGQTAGFGVLLGSGIPLLSACGGDDDEGSAENEPIADGLDPESGPLRLFNYADYVNPEVVAAFEEEYGVSVEITTFDVDSEAITKLANGSVEVDVFHSAAPNTLDRLIAGGLLQPLNRSYLPNFSNVLPSFQDPWYDPGSVYTVPYTVFSSGIGYRADRVDPADVESQGWDVLWNPKYKGVTSILDDYREGIALALLRAGVTDVNTTDPDLIAQAGEALNELVDLMNIKVNIEAYKDIPEGATHPGGTRRTASGSSTPTAWRSRPTPATRCSPTSTSTTCSTSTTPRGTSSGTATCHRSWASTPTTSSPTSSCRRTCATRC
jgi:spermidine/putrescine-binding protein